MRTLLVLIVLSFFAGVVRADGFDIKVADERTFFIAIGVTPPKPDYSKGIPMLDYANMASQSRPVYVWVNYKCPSSADQVSGVHKHVVGYFENDGTPITRPCVVVLKPDGRGKLFRERIIEAKDCCASSLANAVATVQHTTPARSGGA